MICYHLYMLYARFCSGHICLTIYTTLLMRFAEYIQTIRYTVRKFLQLFYIFAAHFCSGFLCLIWIVIPRVYDANRHANCFTMSGRLRLCRNAFTSTTALTLNVDHNENEITLIKHRQVAATSQKYYGQYPQSNASS